MTIFITIAFISTVIFWARDAWELSKKEYEEDKKNKNRRNTNIDVKWTKKETWWTKRTLSLFFQPKHSVYWRWKHGRINFWACYCSITRREWRVVCNKRAKTNTRLYFFTSQWWGSLTGPFWFTIKTWCIMKRYISRMGRR